MKIQTKKLTVTAVLLALCIVGANVKILGSIALDSFPALIGAVILGPAAGGFLGFFGHMISAMLAGFPNTLPIHLIIGILMGVCMVVYGWIRRNWRPDTGLSILAANAAAYTINVPLDLLILYPILGKTVYVLFMPLTIATICNLILAETAYALLPKRVKNYQF